ncbi:calcium-binding mitochondrial carrier protein SCaMC-2-B-like isoform X3 [Penaeus japonicus]|uniref:calcium-binding mitochondrial carrier protein SCaMC-2-B-like isoform X3 n=1 Tax=Penaeus japonicus TaxID=27405 RepID=UPI001C70FBB6|nr:calcium-binding mitochondrial carrier protein SCaMC-2-B-like isoform X3 [Penaeus japonicus]
MATCGPSVSVSSTSGPSSETSPSSGESTPTSLGETSPAAWPDECLDVTTVSEDMIPIAPILQDLQSTESPSHSDSQDSEDVISDVAAELLAETLDFFIEVSNIFANLISDTSEEKPCICTKYVVREGEDGMDKDGTLDISFDEWRDYLLFHPSANLHDIILYWRHATNLDVGEDLSVPDDFSLEEWLSGKWWRHLVAGGVAGMVSRTCTAPLDRLKVFLQVHGAKQFNSLTNCFRYMLQEGGVKSLWRGNGINVLKIAPESALKFAAYEQAKRMVLQFGGSKERELTIYERFVAGSFAGGFSQSVIYPLEVLKTRLALRKTGQYKSIADAAVKIYKQEGLRSFYRGYIPNILGIIPYAGIDLAIYETLKKSYMEQYSDGRNPSVLAIIACGAFSSSCGQVASYPLALVRTRLQAQVIAPGVVHNQPITMSGLFRHIIAKEGPTGLYRGITPNFMKVAPAVSISYVVYEKCRQMLGVSMT